MGRGAWPGCNSACSSAMRQAACPPQLRCVPFVCSIVSYSPTSTLAPITTLTLPIPVQSLCVGVLAFVSAQYSGVVDCFRRMHAEEGLVGFYRASCLAPVAAPIAAHCCRSQPCKLAPSALCTLSQIVRAAGSHLQCTNSIPTASAHRASTCEYALPFRPAHAEPTHFGRECKAATAAQSLPLPSPVCSTS